MQKQEFKFGLLSEENLECLSLAAQVSGMQSKQCLRDSADALQAAGRWLSHKINPPRACSAVHYADNPSAGAFGIAGGLTAGKQQKWMAFVCKQWGLKVTSTKTIDMANPTGHQALRNVNGQWSMGNWHGQSKWSMVIDNGSGQVPVLIACIGCVGSGQCQEVNGNWQWQWAIAVGNGRNSLFQHQLIFSQSPVWAVFFLQLEDFLFGM